MKRAAMMLASILLLVPAFSQHRISGSILDEEMKALPAANIQLSELKRGTVTGNDGSFSFEKIPEGSYILIVTFVGFEAHSQAVEVSSDLELGEIALKRSTIMGEEVIVVATRAGTRTPVAFSEMDREEIVSRNFGQDVPYLLSSSPSLVTSSDAGHGIGYTSMRIRGTDANRINVTINGIPLNDAESHSVYWVDLPDVAASTDNIQIQRGVGTSTNGAAAFGASINFQTQKLKKEPYAVYEGNVGSFSTYRNSISAGTGLIKDHFSVDMRLSDLHSNGYIDRSWTDLQSYYVSAAYHDENTLIKFVTFSGTEELYQAWNGVPSNLLESNRTYNELGGYTNSTGDLVYYDRQVDHYKQTHYQLHLSRAFNSRWYANGALHYTRGSGYYEQYKEDESFSDYLLDNVIIGGDTIRETNLIRRKWLKNDFYGVVGGLHYQGDRTDLVLGGGWNHYDGDHFGTVIWASHAGESEIRHRWYDNTGLKSDWNSYLKTTFEAGERISLFADLQLRGIDYGIEGSDDDLRDITQAHEYLFFNPKAGINLQFSPQQRAYLFVARANREPNRSNFVDADPAGPVPVKETMLDYEAGYTLQASRYSLNVNLYYMDYTDQLVLTGEINDVGSAVMTNVKDSYRAGLEISGSIMPVSWFRWDLNATFSSNKIKDFTGYVDNWDYWSDPATEPYQVVEQLGTTDLAFSPAVMFNSNLDFEPVKSLHLGFISRYVGKQYIDNTSSENRILAPYFINDLALSYSFYPQFMKEISLLFQLSNLFNVKYESNAWVYRFYSGGEEGIYDGYFPQAGIHFMAGIRLRF
jgi:iron complex outermembrane receptor protein